MNIALAYLKNSHQAIYRVFCTKEEKKIDRGQILEWEELKKYPLQAILATQEILESSHQIDKLKQDHPTLPLKMISQKYLSSDDFEKLTPAQALGEWEKILSHWILQNNLNLLHHFFDYLEHLKSLYPNERTSFFEELWHLLKKNLGAQDFKIVFNHLLQKQTKTKTNKATLTRMMIEGDRHPNPTENKELGEILMKNYENLFSSPWKIHEFDDRTGKLVVLATVNQSPILIMGKVHCLGPFQKALFKSFFDGLQNPQEVRLPKHGSGYERPSDRHTHPHCSPPETHL